MLAAPYPTQNPWGRRPNTPSAMPELPLRPPVIVIGMGHSGTTLVSEMLHKAQTPMYSGAMEAGYDDGIRYERPLCQQINTQILGLEKKPKLLVQLWKLPLHPISEENKQRLFEEVASENWGFKDPRTTITYPSWAQAFPDCKTIYVYRRHEEVMRSFFRNRTSLISSIRRMRRGLNSWIHFNRAMLLHIESDQKAGRRHCLVKYEELMSEQGLVSQIERVMDLELFDARNPNLRRNRVTKKSEALLYKMATTGHEKEVLALYRELDVRRLKPETVSP